MNINIKIRSLYELLDVMVREDNSQEVKAIRRKIKRVLSGKLNRADIIPMSLLATILTQLNINKAYICIITNRVKLEPAPKGDY